MSTASPWLAGIRSRECVFTSSAAAPWQGDPGRTLRAADGSQALNIAPGRWLVLASAAALDDHLSSTAAEAGALLFDNDGRWRLMELPRTHAAIHAALDLESLLAGRDCACALMFDAPVVISRAADPERLLICVAASFADSFALNIQTWA